LPGAARLTPFNQLRFEPIRRRKEMRMGKYVAGNHFHWLNRPGTNEGYLDGGMCMVSDGKKKDCATLTGSLGALSAKCWMSARAEKKVRSKHSRWPWHAGPWRVWDCIFVKKTVHCERFFLPEKTCRPKIFFPENRLWPQHIRPWRSRDWIWRRRLTTATGSARVQKTCSGKIIFETTLTHREHMRWTRVIQVGDGASLRAPQCSYSVELWDRWVDRSAHYSEVAPHHANLTYKKREKVL